MSSKGKAMRATKKQIAQETLAISESGAYECSGVDGSFVTVTISSQVAEALRGTVLYRPSDHVPSVARRGFVTRVSVHNGDTLEGAKGLVERYNLHFSEGSMGPGVLNFASAKNPGGGFLSGATAQEECLARCSTLYKCQTKFQSEFYDEHRKGTNEATRLCLYSSCMIYTPGVPVFRNSDLDLLPHPYPVSIITSPAVNMSTAERAGVSWNVAEQAMIQRAKRVLQVFSAHGHRHIVLGAWGCGVFKNPPADIAKMFSRMLSPGGEFEGVFEEVVFSVLDNHKSQATIRAFESLDNTAAQAR